MSRMSITRLGGDWIACCANCHWQGAGSSGEDDAQKLALQHAQEIAGHTAIAERLTQTTYRLVPASGDES